MVAATIRTVFYQPDAESARSTWRRIADGFRPRWQRLAQLMDLAEDHVLAYLAFPHEHSRQLWSTNPQEPLNKEVQRRTDVVGIFRMSPPSSDSLATSSPSKTMSWRSLDVICQSSRL
jgi:transposase-like protein